MLTRLGYVAVYPVAPARVVEDGRVQWHGTYIWSFSPRDVRALGLKKWFKRDIPTQWGVSTTRGGHCLRVTRRTDGDIELLAARSTMRFCPRALTRLHLSMLQPGQHVYVVPV